MGNNPSVNGENKNTITDMFNDLKTSGNPLNDTVKAICLSVVAANNITTNTNIATLTTSVSGLNSKYNTLDADIKTLDTKVNTVSGVLTPQVTSLNTQFGSLLTSFNVLNSKHTALDTEVNTLDAKVNTVTGVLTTQVASLNTQVARLLVESASSLKQTSGVVSGVSSKTVTGAFGIVTTTPIGVAGNYIKTGKSIMMWGEFGYEANGTVTDQITITIDAPTDLNFVTGSVPSVSITQEGSDGAASNSIGLKIGSVSLTDGGRDLKFTVQSFGAKKYRFTWFISGMSQ